MGNTRRVFKNTLICDISNYKWGLDLSLILKLKNLTFDALFHSPNVLQRIKRCVEGESEKVRRHLRYFSMQLFR